MAAPESARGQLWPVVWPLFSLGGVQGQSPGRSRAESSRSPGALESGRLRRTTQCLSGSPASAWGTQARGVTVWLGLRWNGGHPACRHSPYLLVRTCSTFDFSPTPLTPVRSSDWLLALTPNSNVRIVAGSERSDFTPFKAFTYQNGTRARDTQSNGWTGSWGQLRTHRGVAHLDCNLLTIDAGDKLEDQSGNALVRVRVRVRVRDQRVRVRVRVRDQTLASVMPQLLFSESCALSGPRLDPLMLKASMRKAAGETSSPKADTA